MGTSHSSLISLPNGDIFINRATDTSTAKPDLFKNKPITDFASRKSKTYSITKLGKTTLSFPRFSRHSFTCNKSGSCKKPNPSGAMKTGDITTTIESNGIAINGNAHVSPKLSTRSFDSIDKNIDKKVDLTQNGYKNNNCHHTSILLKKKLPSFRGFKRKNRKASDQSSASSAPAIDIKNKKTDKIQLKEYLEVEHSIHHSNNLNNFPVSQKSDLTIKPGNLTIPASQQSIYGHWNVNNHNEAQLRLPPSLKINGHTETSPHFYKRESSAVRCESTDDYLAVYLDSSNNNIYLVGKDCGVQVGQLVAPPTNYLIANHDYDVTNTAENFKLNSCLDGLAPRSNTISGAACNPIGSIGSNESTRREGGIPSPTLPNYSETMKFGLQDYSGSNKQFSNEGHPPALASPLNAEKRNACYSVDSIPKLAKTQPRRSKPNNEGVKGDGTFNAPVIDYLPPVIYKRRKYLGIEVDNNQIPSVPDIFGEVRPTIVVTRDAKDTIPKFGALGLQYHDDISQDFSIEQEEEEEFKRRHTSSKPFTRNSHSFVNLKSHPIPKNCLREPNTGAKLWKPLDTTDNFGNQLGVRGPSHLGPSHSFTSTRSAGPASESSINKSKLKKEMPFTNMEPVNKRVRSLPEHRVRIKRIDSEPVDIVIRSFSLGIDPGPIQIDESSDYIFRFKTPYFRGRAMLEIPPLDFRETWVFGWIQACYDLKFINTYGKHGYSQWSIPGLNGTLEKAISDSDGKKFPWYGIRPEEIFVCPFPSRSTQVKEICMSDNFYPHVTWDYPGDRFESAKLTKVLRDQRFYIWLVGMNTTLRQIYVLKVAKWRMKVRVKLDPQMPLGSRTISVSGKLTPPQIIFSADKGTTGFSGNNISYSSNVSKYIPLQVLSPPSANNCQILTWVPKGKITKSVVVIPPKHSNTTTHYCTKKKSDEASRRSLKR